MMALEILFAIIAFLIFFEMSRLTIVFFFLQKPDIKKTASGDIEKDMFYFIAEKELYDKIPELKNIDK